LSHIYKISLITILYVFNFIICVFQISGVSFSLSEGSGNSGTYIGGNTTVSKAGLVLFAHTVWLISIAWELYLGCNFWYDFYKKGDVNVEEIFNSVLRSFHRRM
jgi:hypothetical protein